MAGGGARPGAGRKPGSVNTATVAERAVYAAEIARHARLSDQTRKAGVGSKSSADDLSASIGYLTRLKLGAIAGALKSGDHKAVIDGINSLEDRLLGKPKYQVEHGGIPDGEPIPIAGTLHYICEIGSRGAPSPAAPVAIPATGRGGARD